MEWVIFFIVIWIFSLISDSLESKKIQKKSDIKKDLIDNTDIDKPFKEVDIFLKTDNFADTKQKTNLQNLKSTKTNKIKSSNKNDRFLQRYNIKHIYHMTHINNLQNILDYGLLAHNNNRVNNKIDNPEVNDRRNFLEPIYQKNVHDYVPFYFNPRNAMLYVNRYIQDSIVILAFNKELIYKEGSIFTDGNASVSGTRFFNDLNDLDQLYWECLGSKYWNDFVDGKRKMMAEVLVPNRVSIDKLEKIYCNNFNTKRQIEQMLQNKCSSIKVEVNNNVFF